MSFDEILILLLALVAGLLLFVGLAQALEGRPRPVHARRSPRLPAAWRSFRAEERVLEHRARGARTGVSPFAPPPRPPVADAPLATGSPPERSAPEQISFLGEAPLPESPIARSPLPESIEPRLEPLPAPPDPVAPPPVVMAAPIDEETVMTAAAPIPEEAALTVATPADAPPTDPPADSMAATHLPADRPTNSMMDEPAAGAAAVPAPASLTPALVAECARLLKAGRPGELRALAEPLLKPRGRSRGRTAPSYDHALLWCLVGLAHREEGEEAGLRAAFEQGIRALPRNDASGPDPAVMALADSLGSQLLASGEAAADSSGPTVAGLRLSVGLLRGAALGEPGEAVDASGAVGSEARDELPPWGKALRAHLAVERARDALANTCGRKLTALLERGDRAAAHRWLQEVTGWDELSDRLDDLEEPYWKAVTGEVTRLTGQALASDDLDAAIRTLQTAEAVVRDLPESASASPRIPELRRRLWWSYTKLGVERLEDDDKRAALEPLYHALRLAEGDADRATETRHSLAQGLEAMAARASDAIAERLRAGDHAAAEAAGEILCRAIDRGLAEGVSQEELAGALDKRQHVMGLIAQADAR